MFSSSLICSDIVGGDLNGDGVPDLALTVTNELKVVVLLNLVRSNGTVVFARQDITVGIQPYQIGIADFDRVIISKKKSLERKLIGLFLQDGFPDLVLTNNGDTTISVLRNSGSVLLSVV